MRPKLPFFIFLGSNFTKLMLVELQNFIQNENTLNSGPKMYCLGTFKPKFEKNIAILEISTSEFVKMQSFTFNKKIKQIKKKEKKKKKNQIWDQNCLIWCCYWIEIWKKYHYIWNHQFWSCQSFMLLDQNCLIWVFLNWNLKNLLSYLKSTNSSLSKIHF